MIYVNIVFIGYLMAMCLSFLCLALILVVLVRREYRKNRLFIAVRNFAATVFFVNLLYFIFYYREMVLQIYEVVLPLRIVDYVVCCGIYFLWLTLLRQMMDDPSKKKKEILIIAAFLTMSRMILSVLCTVLFMGPYYNIENETAYSVWNAIEIVFVAATMLILTYYCAIGFRECANPLRGKYIVICTLLLMVFDVSQGVMDAGLFSGKYGVSAWAVELPDLTGPIMMVLSIATMVFVFREDFSPLFYAKEHVDDVERVPDGQKAEGRPDAETAAPASLTEKLDTIAVKHKLTVREREVIECIYKGYTNPDIAEELYISINTVKKHIRNIYEKLDVNSRTEVIHMVNAVKLQKEALDFK